tara:strand:- start:572522 stop:573163 length:642 start_codon:yes stop_codon:yes gene_type:complete
MPALSELFRGVDEIIFIPYARPGGITYDNYTELVKKAFKVINIRVRGLHEYENLQDAIKTTKGIFVGGGNTFVLVDELYRQNLVDVLAKVIETGTPYLGTSAGSNICGPNMQTTNDMPIVYPPSFKTLGMLSFNINAHYLDPDPSSTHKGETRETRIKEFHEYHTIPVLGLREGSWLAVKGEDIYLKGELTARLFQKNKSPLELNPMSNLTTI